MWGFVFYDNAVQNELHCHRTYWMKNCHDNKKYIYGAGRL